MVVISTSKGDIHLQLDTENTPVTVENFLNYVRSGFYNNTIFHRVIDGFMIQGGGLIQIWNKKQLKRLLKMKRKMRSQISVALLLWREPWIPILQRRNFLLMLLTMVF